MGPDATLPLVLVPGLLCDERLWEPQVGDRRIRELSGGELLVAEVAADETLAAMAGRLLERAPDRFALAGLSMGGYVALEVIRAAPERVGRLALLNTSARPDTEEHSAVRRALIERAREEGLGPVVDELLPRLVHPDRLRDDWLVAIIREMAFAVGEEAFERQERAIIARRDSREALSGIDCPTLILCGREDEITPYTLHEEMAAAIPAAELRMLDNCGHLSTLERSAAVNHALADWLSR